MTRKQEERQFVSNLTFLRAALAIGGVIVVVTILGGVAVRLVDKTDFPNIWLGLWWSLQTVTTVGYGDVVPKHPGGRVIGALVMIAGIGLVTVFTAVITAVFVQSARRRRGFDDPVLSAIKDVSDRLRALETELMRKS